MKIISPEMLTVSGLLYVSLLFFIAWRGDRLESRRISSNSGLIYSLSLAVYCSSWTFFGAVGTASSRGWDFFAIYLGPILLFLLGYRMIQRIILISKQQNITSVSDFISSRYGKSRKVAVLVTGIAVLGSLPYISLQLHAISMAFHTTTSESLTGYGRAGTHLLSDTAFYSAVILAVFTILFGTRHHNATEHHRGMIQAVAFESVVKLLAILLVGMFCARLLFTDGAASDIAWFDLRSPTQDVRSTASSLDFITRMLLSMGAILFLPRQFHVTVVEADSHLQVRSARWLLPAYLVLVSVAVVPIAIAGNHLLPGGSNADLFVLNLPHAYGGDWLVTIAFIGGISAATGMVIVAAISLSTMVCNDIVMPALIHIQRLSILQRPNLNRIILTIRRIAIALIMLFSYGYYRLSDTTQGLANIGLVSFAAIMQFVPAALVGLYWRGANRRGAVAGLLLGFVVWGYCLLMPTLLGPLHIDRLFPEASWLHPQHLFGLQGLSPLTHGVLWSMVFNIGGLLIGSLRYQPTLLDKIQASIFVHISTGDNPQLMPRGDGHHATVRDARTLCQSILGEEASERVFDHPDSPSGGYDPDGQVTRQLVQRIERSIASVIGASSARHVVAKTLLGEDISAEDLVVLMDETSQAITFNRELLQSGFENISQGISVVDRQHKLVAWNSRYVELFEFPRDFLHVGMPVEEVLQFNAKRGEYGDDFADQQVSRRLANIRAAKPYYEVRRRPNGRHIRSQGNPMPGGGFVTSYTDITDTVNAEELLRKVNEDLENRVMERTRDLEQLNNQLQEATEGKTRFLAAASHDLLQPINAARLFNQSIREQCERQDPEIDDLTNRVDRSLISADRLLRTLLDISKLDAGSVTPELSTFPVSELLEELALELGPLAERKGLELVVRPCDAGVYSDRGLLRSMLQNLMVNAIRYTRQGKVLVGCRRRGERILVEVYDTGIGIRKDDRVRIFEEFQRGENGRQESDDKGLGLGLAITQRLSLMLEHPVSVESRVGHGSRFSISVPAARLKPITRPAAKTWVPAGRLDGLKVLCLENSPEVLDAMQDLLRRWGCDVLACSDARQAREAMAAEAREVIIADYSLDGEESGLDFLQQVQSRVPGEAFLGIMISAEQDPTLRGRVRAAGYYFLAKPVDPASLRTLLRRARTFREAQKTTSVSVAPHSAA
jgi:Na+/proline symporter/signal transduction histidine kinase